MTTEQISMFGEPAPNTPTEKPASFTLTKTVNGSTQKVFDQWLIPVVIGTWMFNQEIAGEKVISLDNTVRKGGSFCFKVQKRDKQIEYSGEYLELRIPDQLSFSWIKDGRADRCSQIKLRFESDGDKTRLKFSMTLDPALNPEREAIKTIWTARLAALAGRFK
ncbi:MAG: hypothetical protein ACI95C_002200 [Pseudohongiellaceae bacterium]|jgi:uncharacterized protein YndB with AHSA1/START domain